jgi:hypothetical protein
MRIVLDGEAVGEAIIDYINKQLDTEVKAVEYPMIEMGKKSYELNFETDISVWVYKEVSDEYRR